MYDLLDCPVAGLPAFEGRTLAGIRRWVHAHALTPTLTGGAADDSHSPYATALRLIDRHSDEDLPIGRPCQPLVGDAEAVLIGLWRLVAAGDRRSAEGCAALLVGEDHAASLIAAVRDSLA